MQNNFYKSKIVFLNMINLLLILTTMLRLPNEAPMPAEEHALLYFGDPMCSWCYGFSTEIAKAISFMILNPLAGQ